MKPENLDIQIIEDFSYHYFFASLKFDNIIESQNPKNLKRIRKWINKKLLSNYELSNEIRKNLISLSDNEFIALFKACYDYIESNGSVLEQKISKTCEELPNDVTEAILDIFRHEFLAKNDFKKLNNTIEIIINSSAAYEQKLILFDTKFSTEDFETLFFEETSSFIRQNGSYHLIATGDMYEHENDFNVTISFSSAKTEVKIFNPTNNFVYITPWERLFNLSTEIISKESLNCTFNSYEVELLPLLKEIANLFSVFDRNKSFPIFKNLINKHNFSELLPLLQKIESSDVSTKRKMFLASKLTNKLNFIKYKSLWQEIFDLICESQKEYPTYIESKESKESIAQLKKETTAIMNEHGFIGEYPLFHKKGSIKGIHTIESYDTSYIVGFNKKVIHYIMCEENYDKNNGTYLSFVCANEVLKRNKEVTGFHSCLFNCKDSKFSNFTVFNADFNENEVLSLKERISIAAKTTEFKKLNKDERSKVLSSNFTIGERFAIFLFVFLIGGLFFASLFIPAMMGFTALMLWLDGMPVVINNIPWFLSYITCWVFFGGLTGIITAFLK